MSRRSARTCARLRALSFICGTVAACIAWAPGIAVADAPQRFSFDNRDANTDTATCAFPFDYVYHQYGTGTVFVDHTPGQPSALVHVNVDVTLSANGVTLVERDNYTLTFYQDGSTRNVGVPTHIQGPGGIVLLDAGNLVQAPDGSVIALHGPHPSFFGATFCSALAP
jgi:hypothetical protein